MISGGVSLPFMQLLRHVPTRGRQRMKPAFLVATFLFQAAGFSMLAAENELERTFAKEGRPFLESYCVTCHDNETRKAQLDLSEFDSVDAVVKDCARWELVLERLRNSEMPPKKAKEQPSTEARKSVIAWIEAFREHEEKRTAGDPGPVLARRLSNAEYDYTISDLTGADIRPTRAFPVRPANQAECG